MSARFGFDNQARSQGCSRLQSAVPSFASFNVVNRLQLEHILRAAAGNADARDIVIVGSQAILGAFPDAPAELLVSMEADVFPKADPQIRATTAWLCERFDHG
jgi:hypothetical protein